MAKRKERRGLLITATGHVTIVSVDIRTKLDELYKHTNSSVVQMVDVPDSRMQIWMDEEGKVNGRPVNRIATQLFGQPNDNIVGDVVVLT